MNQYQHSQTYTTFPSHHHFHLNNPTTNSTVFLTPSTNYNLLEENYVYTSLPQPSFYDPSISEHPYEQYPFDNSTTAETIYHPIQSFDQSHTYSNNFQLTEQPCRDFSLTKTQSQLIEQPSIDQKPIVNEAKYKWMETKRAPPKASGI